MGWTPGYLIAGKSTLVQVITWLRRQITSATQIARFMGSTWGSPGSCRPQMDPMMVPWSLLSRKIWEISCWSQSKWINGHSVAICNGIQGHFSRVATYTPKRTCEHIETYRFTQSGHLCVHNIFSLDTIILSYRIRHHNLMLKHRRWCGSIINKFSPRMLMARTRYCIHIQPWDTITHACHNSNGGFADPLLNLEHGLAITLCRKLWDVFAYPRPNLS